MISTNTIASLGLLVIAVAGTVAAGLLSPAHLGALTIEACLLIGVFASVAAVLVVQLWRVQAVAGGGRFQLPATVRTGVYIAIFACVGLVAFDNRTTSMLTGLGDSGLSLSTYCKKPKPVQEEVAAPTQVRKVRGCGLILRAYRLGYAKKLGPCAPKKVAAAKKKAARAAAQPRCNDRQADEPLLHYAWRVLSDRVGKAGELDPAGKIGSNIDEFKTRLGYVSTLLSAQGQAITAAPHAAHHLWVNLPNPRDESLVKRYLMPRKDCSNRYRDMRTKLNWGDGDTAASALLEHAFGRLLFDPLLGEPAGYCREYTIHWNAPADACQRLRESPGSLLSASGAGDSVRAVLARHRAKGELRELAKKLGDKPPKQPLANPRRLVSFQCLIVDPQGTGKLATAETSVNGATVDVRELRTPRLSATADAQLEAYKLLAMVLGGIAYNGPIEQTSIGDLAKQPAALAAVTGKDFALTRLDLLRQSDPFVAGAAAMARTELHDVFPFRFHLQNFVDAFRRVYRRQRGRL